MKNITKKSYSSAFKTKVVKEMLGQEKTVSQICSEYKIHPTQAHKWKKKGIEQMQEGFKNPLKKDSRAAEQEELIADLYNKIGQLTALFPHVSGTISPPTISAHKISRGQVIPSVSLS